MGKRLDANAVCEEISNPVSKKMLLELQGRQGMQEVPSLLRLELFDELETNATVDVRNGEEAPLSSCETQLRESCGLRQDMPPILEAV